MSPRTHRPRVRPRLGPDASLILLAVLAVALLHVAKLLLAPPLVALAEAPAREGERVAVEARVVRAAHGERGRFLMLADDAARLPALAGAGEGPAPGDVVRVVGVVSRFDDGLGISVERIDVLVPAATRPLSPATLARSPEAYEGARVLVRGELRGGALLGGGARVALGGEPAPRDADDALWLAAGTFYYRTESAAYVLSVDAWTRS